jgi:hypothetical protein
VIQLGEFNGLTFHGLKAKNPPGLELRIDACYPIAKVAQRAIGDPEELAQLSGLARSS